METKRCIRRTHKEHLFQTWCGKTVSGVEFYFETVDHAAENGAVGGRLTTCRRCVKQIIKVLKT